MSLSLRIEPVLQHNCRITKGIPKSRLPYGEAGFDVPIHRAVNTVLKTHLGIDADDPRLTLEETRRTQRSVYYAAYHPEWGNFEIKRAL